MPYNNHKTGEWDPRIWGPHYWFFLESVARSYPLYPNEITKRKYYDLIHNFPLFIPHQAISDHFEYLLAKYPVAPYLDKKDSFIRWVNFIHNRINDELEKPRMDMGEAEAAYNAHYVLEKEMDDNVRKYVQVGIILGLGAFIVGLMYK